MPAATELTPEQAEAQRAFAEVTHPVSLFELVARHTALFARIDEAEGEITPETGAELDKLTESIEQKVEVYALVCAQLEAEAVASVEIAEHHKRRAGRKRARADYLKARLVEAMKAFGAEHIKTPSSIAEIRKNSPTVDVLVPEDQYEKSVPEKFRKSTITLKKREAIAALTELRRGFELAIKQGNRADWAELREAAGLAWVDIKQGEHLRFR